MAKLTKKQVSHVAELSNLTLTDTEIKKFTPQLDKIIEFVATLSEVDTDDVESTSQTTGLVNVLRDDKVISVNILKNDASHQFKVKAILKNRT